VIVIVVLRGAGPAVWWPLVTDRCTCDMIIVSLPRHAFTACLHGSLTSASDCPTDSIESDSAVNVGVELHFCRLLMSSTRQSVSSLRISVDDSRCRLHNRAAAATPVL